MEWRVRALVLVLILVIVCAGAVAAHGDEQPLTVSVQQALLVRFDQGRWQVTPLDAAAPLPPAPAGELRLCCQQIEVAPTTDAPAGKDAMVCCRGAVSIEGPDFSAQADALTFAPRDDALTLTAREPELVELRVRRSGGGTGLPPTEAIVSAGQIVLQAGQRRVQVQGARVVELPPR